MSYLTGYSLTLAVIDKPEEVIQHQGVIQHLREESEEAEAALEEDGSSKSSVKVCSYSQKILNFRCFLAMATATVVVSPLTEISL